LKKALLLIAIIPFVLGAAKNIGDSFVGAAVIAKYGLHVTGKPDQNDVILPDVSHGLPWSLINHAVKQAGYGLTQYVGQRITCTRYNLVEKYGDARLSLRIFSISNKVLGAYVSIRDSDGPIPGIFSVNDPNIK
jgi:hypothetical protein